MSKPANHEFVQAITSVIDANSVGVALNTLLQQDHVRAHLRERHFLGVLARHGQTVDQSLRTITKARQIHRNNEIGVYALLGYNERAIGMATVDPSPRLKRQRLQVSPLLAKGPLAYDIITTGPQVSAWVAPGKGREGGEVLTAAYRLLSDPSGPAKQFFVRYVELSGLEQDSEAQAWAIEPQQSPDWVRRSIRAAGYARVDFGYYDDGESKRVAPPLSGLYLHQLDTPA